MKRNTKRISRFLALLTAGMLIIPLVSAGFAAALPALPAHAEQEWSEEYYRVYDTTGDLTHMEQEDLEEMCAATREEYGVDLALLAVNAEDLPEESAWESAQAYYRDSEYGVGENRDGFLVIVEADTGRGHIYVFGDASRKVPQDYLDYVAGNIPGYKDQYGVYGMMYAGAKSLRNYMEEHPDGVPATPVFSSDGAAAAGSQGGVFANDIAAAAVAGAEDGDIDEEFLESEFGDGYDDDEYGDDYGDEPWAAENAEAGEEQAANTENIGADLAAAALPDWFPDDPANFEKFHDETAPRVVDLADIFSDEDEAEMEERLAEIREEVQRDIVVYTDVTSYGFGEAVWSADFYDFNGYGIGDEFEGACLFINMDPNDRGWWVCCTGPDTRNLYSELYANQMDDELYEYMAAGEYTEGVKTWIETFRRLYVKGMPYAPEWMPDRDEDWERTHNSELPRIADDAGLFTEEEIAGLTEKAKSISDKYGIDVAVATTDSAGGMYLYDYAEKYYRYNGLGFGDDYDGLLLVMARNGYGSECEVYASGKGADKMTDVNRSRLLSFCESDLASGNSYRAADGWLNNVRHMEKTGRVSRSLLYWLLTSLGGLAAGSAVGGVSLGGAKSRMAVPKPQVNADRYVVPDSLRVRKAGDQYLRSRKTRTYIPPAQDKSSHSSGGSSGHSTFSSSYSGHHSSTTHSGSGRKF